MCDYSLSAFYSRPAQVGDKLVTKNFGTGTTGFAEQDSDGNAVSNAVVCVLPGTEIAFDEVPASKEWSMFIKFWRTDYKVAIFRQINKNQVCTHHDALEFPDGEIVLLTSIADGRTATVLQLPAAPKNDQEAEEQKRLIVAG